MRSSLPLLDSFWRKHQADGRFQALAFHDTTAGSLDDLDIKIDPVSKAYWGGRPLAVPVLMDPAGGTIYAFGICEYPTVVLIDPEGNVVSAGNESLLPDLLDLVETKLAAPKTPPAP